MLQLNLQGCLPQRALCHLQYLSKTHLLNEPDDADGLFLAKGQGARQAVELP